LFTCVCTHSSLSQPLANIFNLARLLETPHTPEQVSALWTAYHASRSGGTGRGYLCASVPVKTYEAMLDSARRFPAFVLPLARDVAPDASGPQEQAYEMHFMQWGFHGAPTVPTFESVTSPFPTPAPAGPPNPPVATVLFTPLVEYKLHQSFATPHLVLTFHTELAQTHGIVLLRGELTPTAAGGGGGDDGVGMRYHLSQADAQLLALGLQKFYLWNDGEGTKKREALLRTFHEQPAEFKWEELLEHTQSL
jgi:ATP synthase F1 complex assembly factor 1